MSTHSVVPEIILLCMEDDHVTAFNDALSSHWPSHTNTTIKIKTINSRLQNLPSAEKFDLVVSPSNSYGRLDGAFDDVISRMFCLPKYDYSTLTDEVQRVLYHRRRGFLPPGNCELVRFPEKLCGNNPWGCEWVAICPTMRTPQAVNWNREVVYECVWSLMCELEGHNQKGSDQINRILMTPLATGVGKVSKERWANQLVLALKHFTDALENPGHWGQLQWPDIYDHVNEVIETWK